MNEAKDKIIKDLMDQIEGLNKKIKELQEKLERSENTNESLTRQISSLKAQLKYAESNARKYY